MVDTSEDQAFDMHRRRAEVDLDGAPLTRAFLEAYPAIWPRISSFVPAGWDAGIAAALNALVKLSAETGVKVQVAQIKSKLAGLRIYLDVDEYSSGPLEIVGSTPISTRLRSSSAPGSVRSRAKAIVDTAGERCETLCELCGAPGVFRNEGGWLRIACPAHARSHSSASPYN